MRIGWFQGVTSAVVGAIIGLCLVFASTAMLWWNEGRPNLADVAAESRAAPTDRVDPALNRTFVSVTAVVSAREPLGDPVYLRPGPYATLARRSEMFAWVEHSTSDDRRSPRVRYTREWTWHPADSRNFRDPRGHENPPMRIIAASWALRDARLAIYDFVPAVAAMPAGAPVLLTPEMLLPGAPLAPRLDGAYMFVGDGTLATPIVGDLRVSYTAYALGDEATLFGEQSDATIRAHRGERTEMYRLVPGSRDHALRTLDAEHRMIRWLLRLCGFLFIWVALNMLLAPVSAMFDVFPPLAQASRSLVALLTLPAAFALSAVTIVVSAAVHNVWVFVILLVALLALAAATIFRRRS